ncbi:MAG: hypothetical protein KKI04_03175 [Proteobacteria bacterium]|nr:hypothetical protein [Pseudomonadota bacterium]
MIGLSKKNVLVIFLAILLLGIGREAMAVDLFPGDRFQVKRELAPNFHVEGDRRNGLLRGESLREQLREGGVVRGEPAGGGNLSRIRLGHFLLFLSRDHSLDPKRDRVRPKDERNGALNAFKSLPGALQADPSRAMDSIGKIFEPQLNLGIEF